MNIRMSIRSLASGIGFACLFAAMLPIAPASAQVAPCEVEAPNYRPWSRGCTIDTPWLFVQYGDRLHTGYDGDGRPTFSPDGWSVRGLTYDPATEVRNAAELAMLYTTHTAKVPAEYPIWEAEKAAFCDLVDKLSAQGPGQPNMNRFRLMVQAPMVNARVRDTTSARNQYYSRLRELVQYILSKNCAVEFTLYSSHRYGQPIATQNGTPIYVDQINRNSPYWRGTDYVEKYYLRFPAKTYWTSNTTYQQRLYVSLDNEVDACLWEWDDAATCDASGYQYPTQLRRDQVLDLLHAAYVVMNTPANQQIVVGGYNTGVNGKGYEYWQLTHSAASVWGAMAVVTPQWIPIDYGMDGVSLPNCQYESEQIGGIGLPIQPLDFHYYDTANYAIGWNLQYSTAPTHGDRLTEALHLARNFIRKKDGQGNCVNLFNGQARDLLISEIGESSGFPFNESHQARVMDEYLEAINEFATLYGVGHVIIWTATQELGQTGVSSPFPYPVPDSCDDIPVTGAHPLSDSGGAGYHNRTELGPGYGLTSLKPAVPAFNPSGTPRRYVWQYDDNPSLEALREHWDTVPPTP